MFVRSFLGRIFEKFHAFLYFCPDEGITLVIYFVFFVCVLVFDLVAWGDLQFIPSSEDDRKAKLYLCSKYLETFTHVKEREENFAKLSIDLLVGMRDMLVKDQMVYFSEIFSIVDCINIDCFSELTNSVLPFFVCSQYFQTLFRDGECFLHVVSLLHGNAEDEEGEKLVLNFLQTLTSYR